MSWETKKLCNLLYYAIHILQWSGTKPTIYFTYVYFEFFMLLNRELNYDNWFFQAYRFSGINGIYIEQSYSPGCLEYLVRFHY